MAPKIICPAGVAAVQVGFYCPRPGACEPSRVGGQSGATGDIHLLYECLREPPLHAFVGYGCYEIAVSQWLCPPVDLYLNHRVCKTPSLGFTLRTRSANAELT